MTVKKQKRVQRKKPTKQINKDANHEKIEKLWKKLKEKK
jgi:hypothetical protein